MSRAKKKKWISWLREQEAKLAEVASREIEATPVVSPELTGQEALFL
jgi:hypothetical protein